MDNMENDNKFDIVASNVRGLGAIELAQSLLPAFERIAAKRIGKIWLPQDGRLSQYTGLLDDSHYVNTSRTLPNSLSRVVECIYPNLFYPKDLSLIVIGDLPLRYDGKQVVFIHRPSLISGSTAGSLGAWFTSAVSRLIFAVNMNYIDNAIVQTTSMKRGLEQTFPTLKDRIVIISQPSPSWLLDNPIKRSGPIRFGANENFTLFFPSAYYPHKNHSLIYNYARQFGDKDSLLKIKITIDESTANSYSPLIDFIGRLDSKMMRHYYSSVDALLFPSLDESYGLPLVEAMHIGLPIICADRPYARSLCGDEAVYFDPLSTQSLHDAIIKMRSKISNGYWPDWSLQNAKIPTDWDQVAYDMLALLD